MKRGLQVNKSKIKEKLHMTWKKLLNIINAYKREIIVGVIGNILAGIFLLHYSNYRSNNSNTEATIDNTIQDDSNPNDAVPNEFDFVKAISDSISIANTILSDANSNDPESVDVPITKELEKKLAVIQKLSIGNNKDWVDKALEPPYAANNVYVTKNGRIYRCDTDMIDENGEQISEDEITDIFLECVYILDDIIAVTIYFDTDDDSCRAFFVTLLKDSQDIDIVMPETYSSLISDKSLGEFAFTDICGEPSIVFGCVSVGDEPRALYCEEYFFYGNRNYQDFYFAVLDYGMVNSTTDFEYFLSEIQDEINPIKEIVGLPESKLLRDQRDKICPNTYGISSLNSHQTFSLISDYSGFDSLRFKGKD